MPGRGAWAIAVDTGGTFTDAIATDPSGRIRRTKLLSSARLRAKIVAVGERELTLDRDFGAEAGLFVGFTASNGNTSAPVLGWEPATRRLTVEDASLLAQAGDDIDLSTGEPVPLLAVRLLIGTPLAEDLPPFQLRLATTRGTNALLEGKGVRPLLVLPEGFGDLLEIGDQRRPDLFALEHRKQRIPTAMTIEVSGRLDRDGTEIEAFDEAAFVRRLAALPAEAKRCAAVALMNSYRNPAHEQRVAALLSDDGVERISVSSSLSPTMRLLPRAQTAATNAYLAPVMDSFVSEVSRGANGEVLMMTSAGGLEPSNTFRAKDSLLSGPAGGLVGALDAVRASGLSDFITFDMGGTSTDVARVGDGLLPHRFEQRIGGASVLAPALHIETVAAGGGSICALKPEGLTVGPDSAGADPGPACYGRGGPLTVTDVNLLLERLDPSGTSIPLDPKPAQRALATLIEEMHAAGLDVPGEAELLEGLLQIAVERMADAARAISLREGFDPAEHTLVAFGGAGPQHACALADALGIRRILIPSDAGILSARGVSMARIERFVERPVFEILEPEGAGLSESLSTLERQALVALGRDGAVHRRIAQLRLRGQEDTLEFEVGDPARLNEQFRERFENLFGYPPPAGREIELVSLRVSAATPPPESAALRFGDLQPVAELTIESSAFFTLVVEPGWAVSRAEDDSVLLEKIAAKQALGGTALALDLTRHRLTAAVEEMGAVLKRCAISTNVREREDYSCAFLDADGQLAINAPHIPVHLGALGLCVRRVVAELDLGVGDIAITNHPAFGGSHLPDVTLIGAAFSKDGQRIGYLANRAHHAEIGGIAPGSMPPNARNLAEEGVVLAPQYLMRGGEPQFDALAEQLQNGAHPTRNLADNLADLHAQCAALRAARRAVESLAPDLVSGATAELLNRSAKLSAQRIAAMPFDERHAVERLDSGAELHVTLRRKRDRLKIDYTGTSHTLAENLNATPAIVRSATLYALRLLLDEDLPLNEGLLVPVSIVLPECLLNPRFADDPSECPPVVGGNVETSQRLVDALLKALDLQAGSQGSMNNLLFGNAQFGYYETIAGGAGAGADHAGASGLHTHMTNTAITDPEVLEWRYPVRLLRFSLRPDSGGKGAQNGGHGVIREFELLEPLTVSILAEHRLEHPYGLHGGGGGTPGAQYWTGPDGVRRELPGRFSGQLPEGARLTIETPGGGAWGAVTPAESAST